MPEDMLSVETLSRRLQRLERQHRRLRRMGGAGVLLLAGALLTGAMKPLADVDARMVRIVGDHGHVLATFDKDGLLFHDGNGKVQAVLRGDGLSFHDANEKPRAVLSGDALSFHDGNDKLQATLAGARLLLYDAAFKPLAGLAVNAQGIGSLVLSEAAGNELRLTKAGAGLALSDASNQVVWSTRR